MYEFHGWITLQDKRDDNIDEASETNRTHFDVRVRNLQDDLFKAEFGMSQIEMLRLNEFVVLTFHAHVNRRRDEAQEMLDLVNRVNFEFGGSHGLIYEFDEQTLMAGGIGVYTVMVVQNGKIEYRHDPFLSPTERTLESD